MSRLHLPSCSDGSDQDDESGISASTSDCRRKGLTDDLSVLTKTFTRQLWGVASFLAPPPLAQGNRIDRQHRSEAAAVCDVSRSSVSEIDPLSRSQSLSDSGGTVEELSSNELAKQNYGDIDGGTPVEPGNAMLDVSKPHPRSERRINGVGKDLAELTGSVASGFSRILKVMREEIDRGGPADVSESDSGYNFSPSADESETTSIAPQHPARNAFSGPLFCNRFQEGESTSLTRESRIGKDNELTTRSKSCEDDSDQGKKSQRAVGITEEVLAFARNISMHPETWLDFPLLSDDEDDDEYELSEVQKEHVSQIELASPRLAALRIELCPDYMSAGCFWKIYFVLLHPRLTRKDAVLLSTPQIVEARARLLKKLQNRNILVSSNKSLENEALNSRNKVQEWDAIDMLKSHPDEPSGMMESFKIVSLQAATEISSKDFHQIEDHPGAGGDRVQRSSQCTDYGEEIQNKNILTSTVKLAALRYEEEEADADKWLNEEPSPYGGCGVYWGNDEDVSFSDLEEDDSLLASKVVERSISKRSCGWVQPNKSENFQEFEGLLLSNMNEAECVDAGRESLTKDSESHSWDKVCKKPEIGVCKDGLSSADFQ